MIEDWAGVQVKGGQAVSTAIEGGDASGKPAIGFIGLGAMGGPMAMRLVDAGFPVTVFDVRAEAMKTFVDKGAVPADSPKAVADAVENVMVCLPIPDVVRQVALAEDGLIAGGKIKRYVDLSTTGAVTARAVASALSEKGIGCLDCPVSGGVSGAEAGTLSLMHTVPLLFPGAVLSLFPFLYFLFPLGQPGQLSLILMFGIPTIFTGLILAM